MSERLAIIGLGLVNSLGVSADEAWARMMDLECGIRVMARFPRGKYQTDYAGEIPSEAEASVASAAGGPGRGRAFSMALAASKEALRVAREMPGWEKSALVLSTTKAEMEAFERLVARPDAQDDRNYNPHALARSLARELGLSGPVLAVSSACASGLVAIAQAERLIARRYAERALVVGVDALTDFILAGFSCLAAMSKRPCRPYDQARDGLSLGEGAGALLVSARESVRGDVLAYIAGSGVSNDAVHITAPSRTGDGLAEAARTAMRKSGLSPADIDYVNGHGTATPYNDAMEARALHSIFGGDMPPVSSFKGYFGHTLGAAGVIETVLCVLAMRRRTIPASMGLGDPLVDCPVNLTARHLRVDRMSHVLTLKSGFGGINAAAVLSAG